MSYTPLNVIASLGLLKNQGMTLGHVSGIVSKFNQNTVVAAFNAALAAAYYNRTNYEAVLGIGAEIMPGLLGSISSATVNSVLAPIDSSVVLPDGNLATSALSQAQIIFPGGSIARFAQNFGKCSGSAQQTNELFRAAKVLSGKAWEEFGGGITRIPDVATAGFGRLSAVAGVGLKELGAQLQRFGSTENLSELTRLQENLGNPINVVRQMAENGIADIGGIADRVKALGLPIDSLDRLKEFTTNPFAVNKVTQILSSVGNATDLEKIKVGLNMDVDLVLSNAGDLLDPVKAVPELGNFLNKEVFTTLTKTLSGLPGSEQVTDIKTVGELMQQLEDASASELESSNNFFSFGDVEELKDYIPQFENDDDGPTTADLIGIVSGGPIGESLSEASVAIGKVSGTAQVAEITRLLQELTLRLTESPPDNYVSGTFPYDPEEEDPYPGFSSIISYKNAIENEMRSMLSTGNAGLQQELDKLTGPVVQSTKRLASQINSLTRMEVDLTQFGSLKSTIIAFGANLGDLAKQPSNEQLLSTLCTASPVGQAIRLHVIEKKNLEIFQRFGINPPNMFKFRPEDF
jgi:hypothetical protein